MEIIRLIILQNPEKTGCKDLPKVISQRNAPKAMAPVSQSRRSALHTENPKYNQAPNAPSKKAISPTVLYLRRVGRKKSYQRPSSAPRARAMISRRAAVAGEIILLFGAASCAAFWALRK